MYDTYRSNQPPYLYVSEATLQKLLPDKEAWDLSLGLRLADPQSVESVLDEIKSMRGTDFLASHTDWRDAKECPFFAPNWLLFS